MILKVVQLTSRLAKAFDKVVEVLGVIGENLPEFDRYAKLFEQDAQVRKILCLFYQDILDVHVTLLKFFGGSAWELLFESFWPKVTDKISIIMQRMTTHRALMLEKVTIANITQDIADRERAYKEYEKQHEFQDLQNYRLLRGELSPSLYDDELQQFAGSGPAKSGTWLFENGDFKKWADVNNKTRLCLWLQGIPGAGKTVLTAKTIRYLQSQGQTLLFAFLSYRDERKSKPVKIFQSLVFQLLEEQSMLHPLLHDIYLTNYRKLISNPDFVGDLLGKLLQTSGPTIIVIDGVDEAAESDKSYLVRSLLRVTKSGPNVKLFVSSRMDSAISKELMRSSTELHVEDHNEGDIHELIDMERDDLLSKFRKWDADEATCDRVGRAFQLLKEKSDGMILYAKLMARLLQGLDNEDDIRRELDTLPEGLGQAYGRVIERIESNPVPKDKAAARKILEWIGSATRPLRYEEVIQALVIESGSSGFTKGRKAFRDIVETCGPIIEVVGDYVSFVHFTAKEYLFNGDGKFLDKEESNLHISLACLTYLAFQPLDRIMQHGDSAAICDETSKVLSGDFVLLDYAASEWLSHVGACAQSRHDEQLVQAIRRLYEKRGKPDVHDSTQVSRIFKHKYRALRRDPELVKRLGQSETFLNRSKLDLIEADGGCSWYGMDPTYISQGIMRFRDLLESSLCTTSPCNISCNCTKIKRLYGHALFRCPRISCPRYIDGFETDSARSEHHKTHERPYKCSHSDCLFSQLGFRTANDLARHADVTHNHVVNDAVPWKNFTAHHLSESNIVAIMEDTISLNQVGIMTRILSKESGFLRVCCSRNSKEGVHCDEYTRGHHNEFQEPFVMDDALRISARAGTTEMMECVIAAAKLAKHKVYSKVDLLAHAIRSGNNDALGVILQHYPAFGEASEEVEIREAGSDSEYDIEKWICFTTVSLFELAFAHANGRAMKALVRAGARPDVRRETFIDVFKTRGHMELMSADNPKTRDTLGRMKVLKLPSLVLQYGLQVAIQRSSAHYAEFCVDMGANVNGKWLNIGEKKRRERPTMLFLAIKSGCGPIFKLLLEHGALLQGDEVEDVESGEIAGMKKIEKYFSMSWKEMMSTFSKSV